MQLHNDASAKPTASRARMARLQRLMDSLNNNSSGNNKKRPLASAWFVYTAESPSMTPPADGSRQPPRCGRSSRTSFDSTDCS
jgi:hypothetical protein